MVIATEAQEKARDIIRADLDAQFRGKVRFGSIRITLRLEVWPESHRPGFALRQADVLQSYTA